MSLFLCLISTASGRCLPCHPVEAEKHFEQLLSIPSMCQMLAILLLWTCLTSQRSGYTLLHRETTLSITSVQENTLSTLVNSADAHCHYNQSAFHLFILSSHARQLSSGKLTFRHRAL
jgi:hypothetical protein